MKKTLLVMGGDRRMEYAAKALSDDFDVYTYGFSASKPIWELSPADILVLPYYSLSGEYLNTPLISQKIPAVSALDMLKYGGTLFGGGLSESFLSYCCERDAKIFDFMSDEELTVHNALLTAEGAAEIVLKETEISVSGSKVVILGFGRVGKACAKTFSALGADIAVAARSDIARKTAESFGYRACGFIDETELKSADTVINTVPERVLGRSELVKMKEGAFILDLASSPYGTDFETAKELKINAVTAPGLPGKTAPKTAGLLIAKTIIKAVKEGV